MDQYIRKAFKKTFMTKKIYQGKPSGYMNECLANLIINKQFLAWDKTTSANIKDVSNIKVINIS